MAMRGRSQLTISGRCTADVAANLFVGADFNKSAAGSATVKPIGVAERPYKAGELVDAVIVGEANITLGATLAAGALVTSDGDGKAVAVSTSALGGQLLEGGILNDVVAMIVK
jgi:uncharacterized protein DUF2190